MRNLAILSPNQDGYSETFIQAHRNLPFNIKFYYGGWLPDKLEGFGSLFQFTFIEKIKNKLSKHLNVSEQALSFSLMREKVDCVLAEYGPTACGCLKAVKGLNIPMIVHFHGFDASRISTLHEFGEPYKDVFAYASRIIVVSKRMKNDLIGLGCPANKIELSVYGPNPLFFENDPGYESQQFLSVGRFTEKKAPNLTIMAFQQVVKKYPQAKLVMAGDGELLNSCKELVKELELGNNVEFKGALPPAEIKKLMQVSIAFVQHSVVAKSGDSEGTPVAILEAQAASLPVVSTYHAGIPDVVIDGVTGMLVEEFDTAGMANAMIQLFEDRQLIRMLGRNARERISANFTLEKHLAILTKSIDDTFHVPHAM